MSESMEKVLEYLGERDAKPVATGKKAAGSAAAARRKATKGSVADLASRRAARGAASAPDTDGLVVRYQIRNRAVDVLAKRLAVPAEWVLHVSAIPPRTFHRRQQLDQALSPSESDRVLRIARIASEAERVFGSPDKSSRWLSTAHPVLGATPLDLLATDAGTQDVEEELGRIEHGIFA
ncbi:type II RES/Xre toxin-antitoxin system antitoxin [Luteimonas sp. SDU101]|uniref:type II RES/Xre toxin-antitoxin system antitoxin n=1 Tax=unclassified Luteimonas TaxID=2629088 RepID=UPI003EB71FBB